MRRGILSATVASFVVCLCLTAARGQELLNESFDSGAAPANLILTGTAAVGLDACGANYVLSLTQAVNTQLGIAWFDTQFDLTSKRVEVEFDILLGPGTNPPADGASVVFQFDGDTAAAGAGGGGLGTGNFRGNNSPPRSNPSTERTRGAARRAGYNAPSS